MAAFATASTVITLPANVHRESLRRPSLHNRRPDMLIQRCPPQELSVKSMAAIAVASTVITLPANMHGGHGLAGFPGTTFRNVRSVALVWVHTL